MTVANDVLIPALDLSNGPSIISFFIAVDSRIDNPNDNQFLNRHATSKRAWQCVLTDKWTAPETIFSHLKKRVFHPLEEKTPSQPLFHHCFSLNPATVCSPIFSVPLALSLCEALSHLLNCVI